jgi:solute carrier family 39 (zinc transporter), member 1/2/3
LLHLLPEAADDFTKALGVENSFPFAYLITIWSFTLILFIEKIAID